MSGNRTFNSFLIGSCIIGACLSFRSPAFAIPPPPDPKWAQFSDAMHALDPLIGAWEGSYDGMRVRARRVVARGPQGELYFGLTDEHNHALAGLDRVYVVQFDIGTHAYTLVRPGFWPGKKAVIEIEHPNPATLQWDEPVFTGGPVNRTIISVQDGTWREVIQRVGADGETTALNAMTLKRVGDARFSLADDSILDHPP